MIMCAGLSVNALTSYFADTGSVDFSAAPGILISLFNLVVLGMLLMIPLMALEKINMETSVLLRKMNQVAVELGKSLEENVGERFREEQRASSAALTAARSPRPPITPALYRNQSSARARRSQTMTRRLRIRT